MIAPAVLVVADLAQERRGQAQFGQGIGGVGRRTAGRAQDLRVNTANQAGQRVVVDQFHAALGAVD